MTWTKGQSGNRRGRPNSERALAKVLRNSGEQQRYSAAKNKELLAGMVWEGLIWGKVTLPGEKTFDLSAKEWIDLLKWVHSHVDGAYQPEPPEDDPRVPAPRYVYGPDELTELFKKRLAECDGDITRLWQEERADEVEVELETLNISEASEKPMDRGQHEAEYARLASGMGGELEI